MLCWLIQGTSSTLLYLSFVEKSPTRSCRAFFPSEFSPEMAHPSAKALRLKFRTKPYTNTLAASKNTYENLQYYSISYSSFPDSVSSFYDT